MEFTMKVQVLGGILAAALLASCASVSDPKLLAPLTKLTLVSVSANPQLYYVGDQPPKADLLDNVMNVASNEGKNLNVANRLLEKTEVYLAKSEELLAAALASAKGSTLIPKDTLFASQAYGSAAEDKIVGVAALRPAGYKFIRFSDAALAGKLVEELGANGMISASFVFQKVMAFGMMGTGTLGSQTTMTIQAFDSKGKLVFTKVYLGVSKTNTGVVANVYDPAKYEPVVMESAKIAVDRFAADLAAR